jgi:hypothetical protein
MLRAMGIHRHDFIVPRQAEKLELVLRLPDGRPWSLTFSPGIERFIGYYPRLDGVDPGGALLSFRTL